MALQWHLPNFSQVLSLKASSLPLDSIQIVMDILYNPDNGAPFFDSILFRENAFFTFSFVLNNCPEVMASLPFIGYISAGSPTVLYPLYSTHADLVVLKLKVVLSAYLLTPLLHDAYEEVPGLEVPIYAQDHLPPMFILPLITWNFGDTIVHLALHPSGYDPVLYSVGFPLFNSTSLLPMPDLTALSYDHTYATWAYSPAADSLESGFPGSLISSSILKTSHNGTSAYLACGGNPNAHMSNLTTQKTGAHHKPRTKTKNTTLQRISHQYPNWGKALANLRCMIRAAICCRECPNLFLLVMSDYVTEQKALLNSIWPDALTQSKFQLQDLENMVTIANNTPMSEADILALGDTWFSLFMHDNKCHIFATLKSNRAGFDLSTIFGTTLNNKVISLLSKLKPPQSNRLPLTDNGIAWFLLHQVTKEFMYYVIFWHNSTQGNHICLADLCPAIFRHAAYPPMATLALALTNAYIVLLTFLDIEVKDFHAFMSTSNFHAHVCQMLPMLFEQSSNSGHTAFMLAMKMLCDVRKGDVKWLPDSLFTTASMLFGLVDPLDIKALIEAHLMEDMMQTTLQQEEESCLEYLK
ncbi:uncharacterized protein BJ212DRAFT_1483146 [Suillus subaureus]|uniref:Uncharacterized protein n=1 Tax=Suillus subaureus TaxID=48587 RepID=A0A9P7E6A7_9AGAM|nr:uncharacterized protein BJ212DRAFT_1483146 [Suillus subaureus]KAG1812535.1 hypothetical protein BJ212DRAFT_1483146 [Suillus subaureus]